MEPNNSIWRLVLLALNVGFEIFSVLIAGVFLGLLVDHYLNIQPIGILIGSLLGIVGSFKKILAIGGKHER